MITATGGIDPYLFRDSDDSLWLYYKNDADGFKNIWVQRLSGPRTKYSGYNAKLCVDPQPGTWEDNGYVSAEGPCLRKYAGKYLARSRMKSNAVSDVYQGQGRSGLRE